MARMTVLVAIVLMMGNIVWAQTNQELAQENAQLKDRVENLERQVQNLSGHEGAPGTMTTEEPSKKSIWSNLDIQLYGYIKGDAAWDSSRVTTGNFMLYGDRGGEDNDEFNLTARQSRIGLKINGPEIGQIQTSGLVEGDFYGAGGVENKPNFRMRHAYMKLLWPESHFSILAGQTWDVISPLYPDTLNFTILWDAGNVGYRHPQIRLTQEIRLNSETTMELSGAISRTISDLEEAAGAGRPGEATGFPTVQGRVALTFPVALVKPTTIGVSGHWGQEEYLNDTERESWSVNLDVLQPINKWLSLKGEAFTGENLDDYFGGIGQGVRIVRDANDTITSVPNGINSKGGWAQATLTPIQQWRFNIGAGVDNVDDSDVANNARTQNSAIYGNAIYAINKNADIGVELSQWHTKYKSADDVDDTRIQASFIYKF